MHEYDTALGPPSNTFPYFGNLILGTGTIDCEFSQVRVSNILQNLSNNSKLTSCVCDSLIGASSTNTTYCNCELVNLVGGTPSTVNNVPQTIVLGCRNFSTATGGGIGGTTSSANYL
jgi:hypothetical protein